MSECLSNNEDYLGNGIDKFPLNWEILTVDDLKGTEKKSIISGPFGSNISSKYFVLDGVPVIRGNNLSLNIGKKFIDEGFVYISDEKANELNTWAIKNDIIFTAVGTIGQVGLLKGSEKYTSYIISNKQLRFRVNLDRLNPYFAYYWFASDRVVEEIKQRNTGSSVPLINLPVLKSLTVNVPPLPEQKAIANVLSSLDDKIDLLHRQNKTLEAMAETLFRQWFIEEAKEDWEDGCLGDIAMNIKDAVQTPKIKDEWLYVGLEHISRRNIALNQHGYGRDVSSNKFYFKQNDILFGKLRPYFHKVCFSPIEGICSTDILVLRPIKSELFAFSLFAFYQDDVVEFANLGSGGTRMPRTDWNILKSFPIVLPDKDTIIKFNDVIIPSLKKITENISQIQTLEKLRDNLLPKLMSGEVRVAYDQQDAA